MTPHSWSSDSSQISACAASSNQWAIHSKGAGRVSEDFTGGWSGSSSIIAPPLSLLGPLAEISAMGRYSRWRRQINFRWDRGPRNEEMKITDLRCSPGSWNKLTWNSYCTWDVSAVLNVFSEKHLCCWNVSKDNSIGRDLLKNMHKMT